MSSYTVHKIVQEGSKQLLLVDSGGSVNLCVYDEHTGTTLLRSCAATLDNLRLAIELLV